MNILEFIPRIFINYSRIFMNYSWSRKQGIGMLILRSESLVRDPQGRNVKKSILVGTEFSKKFIVLILCFRI